MSEAPLRIYEKCTSALPVAVVTSCGVDEREASIEYDSDETLLRANGHQSVLPRQFGLISLTGFAFGTISSELGIASGLLINLQEGGTSSLIWGSMVGAVVVGVMTLGMAEMASAYPCAGAQYHWAFILSAKRYKGFAAFMTGWINILGWWFGTASLSMFCGSVLIGIVKLWYPEYTPERYQFWLCYVGCNAVPAFVNIFMARHLPAINVALLWLQISTWLVTIVVLCSMASQDNRNASEIFGDRENLSGWSNDGIAYLIAIGNSMYAYIGTDAAAHLAEELPSPEKVVPKAMMASVALGWVTAFPFSIVLSLVIKDKLEVINTPTGLSYLALLQQATGSRSASTVLILLFWLCFMGSCNAGYTSVSRLTWAFARDNGLPFSPIFVNIHRTLNVPICAILLAFSFNAIWGLVFIASTTVFNAFLSSAIVFAGASYAIPQAILILRKRSNLHDRPLKLGRLGYLVNWFSVLWMVLITIVFCLPPVLPVTRQNCSYISVLVVGLPAALVIFWVLAKRRTFHGPVIDEARLQSWRS